MEEGGVVVGVFEWQLNLFSSAYHFPVGYLRGKAENGFGEKIALKFRGFWNVQFFAQSSMIFLILIFNYAK